MNKNKDIKIKKNLSSLHNEKNINKNSQELKINKKIIIKPIIVTVFFIFSIIDYFSDNQIINLFYSFEITLLVLFIVFTYVISVSYYAILPNSNLGKFGKLIHDITSISVRDK